MLIDLSQVLSGRIERQSFDAIVEFENDKVLTENGVVKRAPLDVKGEVASTDGKLLLNMVYKAEWVFNCGRCLCDVQREISGSLCKELLRTPIEDDDNVVVLSSKELDISKLLWDEVILNLPLQVLCNEDCKGLCPNCGINLNVETCNCDNDYIDPRLEGLKNFFNED